MDLASFEPILKKFVELHPDVRVAYRDVNTIEHVLSHHQGAKKARGQLSH